MPLYPLFADLAGREVLVVGGGDVAARKIAALLKAGASVRLHAQAIVDDEVAAWLEAGLLTRLPGDFDPTWLDVVWLVVAATDDSAFNAHLAEEAGRRRRLINVVDDAALSTFQVPALVDRSPLMVAISTAGTAPMLARRVREQLEATLDPVLGVFADLFGRHRDRIRQALPDLRERRRWFEQVLDGPIAGQLRSGALLAAEADLLTMLAQGAQTSPQGAVALAIVPPVADLLTLRSLRTLNQADVIVIDGAVTAQMLEPARRDARRIAAGNDPLATTLRAAAEGMRVVLALAAADPALQQALAGRCRDAGIPYLSI